MTDLTLEQRARELLAQAYLNDQGAVGAVMAALQQAQQPVAQAVAPEVAVAWEVCAAVNGNIWRRVYSEEEFKEYTDAGWKGRRLFERSA